MMSSEVLTIPPPSRRRAFLVARAAIARDDLATARPIVDGLMAERPGDLEVRLYAAWLHAQMSAPSPEELSALEGLALHVLGECQALALPLCALGDASLRRNEPRAAGRLYRRALEADPLLLHARRGQKLAEDRLRRKERSVWERVTRWTAEHPAALLGAVAALGSAALWLLALR